MSEKVVLFSHDTGHRLVLSTPGRFSMDTAAEILSWLEEDDDCSISDLGWKTRGHGRLVEHGIHVVLGSIAFDVMCSYEEIFITRASGNRRRFVELCETIQQEFLTAE